MNTSNSIIKNLSYSLCTLILTVSPYLLADEVIDKTEIAKCSLIDGTLERLQCFDDVAKKHSLDGIQTSKIESPGNGKWIVNISKNPLDDSQTVTAILIADSGADYLGRKVSLIARCKSNITDLYINWQDFLADNNAVTSRIGKAKAENLKWERSNDKKATFHPRPIGHLRNMFGESTYVAQITPYNSSPTTAIFDISGIENALKPLMQTCKWKREPSQINKKVKTEAEKKPLSTNDFYKVVSTYHSNYIRGLNKEFSGKTIGYDSTELKFINLQYVNNIDGCNSPFPSRIGEQCIKINMLDLRTDKKLLYTPAQIRKVGYKVLEIGAE